MGLAPEIWFGQISVSVHFAHSLAWELGFPGFATLCAFRPNCLMGGWITALPLGLQVPSVQAVRSVYRVLNQSLVRSTMLQSVCARPFSKRTQSIDEVQIKPLPLAFR
jgi:hypothetical protein